MLKCSPTFTPPSFGLPIPSPRFPRTSLPRHLCPGSSRCHRDHRVPRAPLPDSGCYPPSGWPLGPSQKALPLLHCSYGPMRQTSILPAPRVAPCPLGLCRLLRAPAGCWPFPTLSLSSLWRCSDPYHVVSASCTCPFLRWRRRPHARRYAFGTRDHPCKATSTGGNISRLQSFDHLRAPPLARPSDRSHHSPKTGRPGRLRHA